MLHLAAHQLQRSAPIQRSLSCLRNTVLPKARQNKCCVLQHTNLKPHWRRISTRRLTEALPKTRPVLVLHLAAHLLQIRAPIQCDANRCNPSCQWNTALPKARQGKCSCCVLQNVEFKLRWRRTSTRQLTEALPKAGQVLMLHRRTATSKQSTHPVRCQPLQLVVPADH